MDFVVKKGQEVTIQFSDRESEAVKIAINHLQKDLFKVAQVQSVRREKGEVIIGTLGISNIIESYLDRRVLTDSSGELRKEAYVIKVCEGKLVIAGTDRRGTIYGIYEFCESIGVSPWYFFADVPIKKKEEIRLQEGFEKIDYPSVEYRGIFINDEEELEKWVKYHMEEETIGVKTYEKIFELLLRLKANYIWPAMHVNSFNMVPENGALADRMGIVVGTSHCDMLMRSNNREWTPWIKQKGYTDAKYDYSIEGQNREILKEYWRESVEQNAAYEVSYTLGMRGIHDSGFETRGLKGKSEEEILQEKVKLLEKVIQDQRDILKETLQHDTLKTFVPYKEVLHLYDSGLQVPEDMTLIWANDNYGYVRRYPSDKEKKRKGGNGIYYHNSYWARAGMSYLFICSIPLAHTRNELQKAYEEGIQKLWVLNVGAIKPLEQEMEFFIRLAWDIGKEGRLTADVDRYLEEWINRNFTGNHGRETAKLLNDFSQLTNVRKLEHMTEDVFSQTAYGDEAVGRIHQYRQLFEQGNLIYESLPKEEKDAFFQLVLMKIHAAYFTNCQYYYADRSTLCYEQGKMQAAALYTKYSKQFDENRRKLLHYYNHIMADGKWSGIVTPEDFPPPRTAMYPACTPPLHIGERKMLLFLWNEEDTLKFNHPGEKWFEIANGGSGTFQYRIDAPEWVELSCKEGIVQTEERILVTVPTLEHAEGTITVHNLTDHTSCSFTIEIKCKVDDYTYQEEGGRISIEGDSVSSDGWNIIKCLGRGSGNLVEARQEGAILKYPISLLEEGECLLEIHRFPSLNSTGKIRVGCSVDDGEMQIIESASNDEWRGSWKENVLNNVEKLYLTLPVLKEGKHLITLHAVDKYFSFSRIVIYTKERKENNLGTLTGYQGLPIIEDIEKIIEGIYGEISLPPRSVKYGKLKRSTNTLIKSDTIYYPESYGPTVEVSTILKGGAQIYQEAYDSIRIDAASALAQTPFAFIENYKWQHCNSESYGGNGLAMYIRKREMRWGQTELAPSLNYKIRCSGGNYTVWTLIKFNSIEDSYMAVGMDGKVLIDHDQPYKNSLWKYEAEQVWRWVPIVKTFVEAGEHILTVYAYASGIRVDRIYLTRGEEYPPEDCLW